MNNLFDKFLSLLNISIIWITSIIYLVKNCLQMLEIWKIFIFFNIFTLLIKKKKIINIF